MKKFIILSAFLTLILSNCKMTDKNILSKKGSEQTEEINNSRLSAKVLSGTSWIADYSDKEQEYYIMFTDTTFTCVSILRGDTTTWNYPYYMSALKPSKFDKNKVGGTYKGDYIVFYDNNKISTKEIIWMSPTQLITVSQYNDTIAFTRKSLH